MGSPLTTSYSDTNEQVRSVVGGPLSLKNIQLSLLSTWQRVKERCVEACTSTSSADCEACGGVGGDQLSGDRGGTRGRPGCLLRIWRDLLSIGGLLAINTHCTGA